MFFDQKRESMKKSTKRKKNDQENKLNVKVPAPPPRALVWPDGGHPQAKKCQRVVHLHSIIHSVFKLRIRWATGQIWPSFSHSRWRLDESSGCGRECLCHLLLMKPFFNTRCIVSDNRLDILSHTLKQKSKTWAYVLTSRPLYYLRSCPRWIEIDLESLFFSQPVPNYAAYLGAGVKKRKEILRIIVCHQCLSFSKNVAGLLKPEKEAFRVFFGGWGWEYVGYISRDLPTNLL